MKKQLSVFSLIAQNSIYKVLGILLLTALPQILLVFLRTDTLISAGPVSLEDFIEELWLSWGYNIGILLLALYFFLGGGLAGGQDYTLKRLSVSEYVIFFWQSIFCILSYFLLMAMETVLAFFICRYFTAAAADAGQFVTGQTIFFGFLRSDFLYSLLPLQEITGWIHNLLWLLLTGTLSAYCVFSARGEHRNLIPFLAVLWSSSLRIREPGDLFKTFLLGAVFLSALAIMITMLRRIVRKEDEER